MPYPRLTFLFLLFLLTGCNTLKPVPITTIPDHQIDYQSEVQPILVKRCVVCHSCYNSPCQLKLESFEGLERGASKQAVYNAKRRETMDPTRLFIDAQTVPEWRRKGFQSVTTSTTGCGENNSILLQLLEHKKNHAMQDQDSFKPEEDELTCAQSESELEGYLSKHPNRGMPYGFPPLAQEDFNKIAGWLTQGAIGPEGEAKDRLMAIPPEDQEKIRKWEAFFNMTDAKHAVTARYLYEHLFLAHIRFPTGSNNFYELVRSRTPSGKPVEIIATNLPYDDPGPEFYYRFRKIHSTIVHKTHMVFELSDEQYQRIEHLFIDKPWPLPEQRVSYDPKISANPFKAFEQIPTGSRYRFLLDNIHFIIMNFIRGPVCKGQVALNVVQDHFWLVFLDPKYDLSVQDPGFLMTYGDLLEMPLLKDDYWGLFASTIKREYRRKSSEFAKKRQDYYASRYRYEKFGEKARAIWPGGDPEKPFWRAGKSQDTPLLTVFRHFDSASVEVGPKGNLPQTMWVMDYPLVERIYYSLVAGFNVFGHKMHQASIRIYMDELRQEGETYFIDFMPKNRRYAMMKEWYGGMDLGQVSIDYSMSDLETGFAFKTNEPKREFIEYLVEKHFRPEIGMAFDRNYLHAGEPYPQLPVAYATIDDLYQGFRAVSKPGTAFLRKIDDHNANLAYLHIIKDGQAKDQGMYFSMVVNRWHDDVTTLYEEDKRLRPELDSAVFLENFIGSYPNYFFEVYEKDLPEFFKMLTDFDGCPASLETLDTFGVNRAQKDFWEVYDRFQKEFDQLDPVQAGLFDLNRYYYQARVKKGEGGSY